MQDDQLTTLQKLEHLIADSSGLKQISDTALATAEQIGRTRRIISSGPADAFRHMIFIGELTRRYGPTTAKAMGDIHEFIGSNAGQPANQKAMDTHNNALGVEIGQKAKSWEDVVRLARDKMSETIEKGNEPSEKSRPYWINDVPVNQWAKDWKTRPIPKLDGGDEGGTYDHSQGHEPDAFARGYAAQINEISESKNVDFLREYLTSEGDPEDEALLKDDLTQDELKRVMMSNAYNDQKDPRFEAVNKRVRWWFEDRFGNRTARTDTAGRIVQPKEPRHPAPERPLTSSVAKTGVPLSQEIGKIVGALQKSGTRTAAPPQSVRQKPAKLDSRSRGNDIGSLVPSRIANLQETLNVDDLRHDGMVRDEPLRVDGIAGPKTRRALRRTVARFGAEPILSRLIGS